MMTMEFHDDTHTVTLLGRDLALLPKEYALFKHLCDHEGQTLSRGQLLDAVWSMENPVDRTVDDHIYRIRRSLRKFTDKVRIETVRGRGYRLLNNTASADKPALQLPTVPVQRRQVRDLFYNYVLSGAGDGLRALTQSSGAFGLDKDLQLLIRSRIYAGDFRSVVELDCPFHEKAFWLLALYDDLHFDDHRSLGYWQRAIDSYILSTSDHMEAVCITLPKLYRNLGEFAVAQSMLSDAIVACVTFPLEGFLPLLRLDDAAFEIFVGNRDAAREKLTIAERTVESRQWQREMAYLSVVRGYFALMSGDERAADKHMESGLDLLRDIQFVNHQLLRASDIVRMIGRLGADNRIQRKYSAYREELMKPYTDDHLERDIEALLDRHLRPL